jgi:ubiquinone/menaquinone biosynthesis C-methylase UbiE
MAAVIVVVLAVGGAVILASLAWRTASHYRSLPCPTALAWLLDNPLAGRVLGTQSTLQWMGLRPGQRVLEIGPGPGRLSIPAARQVLPGGEVVGLEIQPGMLDRLKARAAQAGVTNLTAVLGDAPQAHFAPESFDVVCLCTVLGEIHDRAEVLRQCWQVLRPGGRLSITEVMVDPHYQSRATVQRLAEGAGFELEHVYSRGYRFTANFVKE